MAVTAHIAIHFEVADRAGAEAALAQLVVPAGAQVDVAINDSFSAEVPTDGGTPTPPAEPTV